MRHPKTTLLIKEIIYQLVEKVRFQTVDYPPPFFMLKFSMIAIHLLCIHAPIHRRFYNQSIFDV